MVASRQIVSADIPGTDVVAKDDDNIGFLGRGLGWGDGAEQRRARRQ